MNMIATMLQVLLLPALFFPDMFITGIFVTIVRTSLPMVTYLVHIILSIFATSQLQAGGTCDHCQMWMQLQPCNKVVPPRIGASRVKKMLCASVMSEWKNIRLPKYFVGLNLYVLPDCFAMQHTLEISHPSIVIDRALFPKCVFTI